MRRSSLNNIDVALDREVDGMYDVIHAVSEKLTEIGILADNEVQTILSTVVNSLPNISIVNAASDIIANLNVVVTATLPAGSNALATLNGSTIELQIPVGNTGVSGANGIQGVRGTKGDKGDKGDTGAQGVPGENGIDGSTPTISLMYDNLTGNLSYEVTYV